LAFTTEEIWDHLAKPAGAPESVHLATFPEPQELTEGLDERHRERARNWDRLLEVRDAVLKRLEEARQEKAIGAPLEARVHLRADGDLYPLLAEYIEKLPEFFIVSQVSLEQRPGEFEVIVERASGRKCERCWKYSTEVGADPAWPTICPACAAAVTEILKG
jgi:isoleucyl-tRNA synthetase